ncbi:MAG: hypothetical protein EBR30_00140 [Cytophagia bacterium]|jgi:hypothetical protein|nr:hypothetical protein [Cytophagia bacterium]
MDPLDQSLELCLNGDFNSSENILKNLDQNNIKVKFNLGWHYLRQGDLKKGFEGLNAGRELNVLGTNKFRPGSLYTGQNIKNKTVLFICEGGFGDEIINIRFVEFVLQKGAKVIVSCHPLLFPIFKNIPGINALCDSQHDTALYYDYYISGMTAPLYLNLTYKDISGAPYLHGFLARKLFPYNNKLKVGLKWSGNPRFEHEQYRKFPAKLMFNLLDIPDITFYSLQRDHDLVDDDRFIDLRYELKSWLDTAEIIMGLDLIITSCTSTAHLAAAMGKPTWVIIPVLSYYVWALPGNTSPWYNSVTLYRQVKYNDWSEPFNRLEKDLKNYKKYPESQVHI